MLSAQNNFAIIAKEKKGAPRERPKRKGRESIDCEHDPQGGKGFVTVGIDQGKGNGSRK